MTTDQEQNIIEDGVLITVDKGRMGVFELDQHYISAYLDNPSSKVGALRTAAQRAGIDCDVTRQRAHEIHRRLRHNIDRGLIKRMIEGATLGYSVLYKMAADENTGETNRLKAAALLIEYSGKNKPKLSNDDKRDRVDIQDEIKATKERIEQATGKRL